MSAWAEKTVVQSDHRGREFTRQEVKTCVPKIENKKAAWAHEIIVTEVGIFAMMGYLCCILGCGRPSTYAPKRWRK